MRSRVRAIFAKFIAKLKALNARLQRSNLSRRFSIVVSAETHLSIPERLFLYAIVRGTIPQRALEIGTALGGSASIIAAAMEDNGSGRIVGLDPTRRVDPTLAHFYGRFQLIQQEAPDGVDDASRAAGGKFDFVFYDGPNVYVATSSVISTLLPYLSDPAFIVIDNGFHYGVHKAIDDLIIADSRLHDCGFVCVKLGVHDRHAAYNGLRLIRFDTNKLSDPQPVINREYASAGLPAPSFDLDVLNHDGWWCRTFQACPKCARGEASDSKQSGAIFSTF
jgi:predicted O-methyltransferase YrrM